MTGAPLDGCVCGHERHAHCDACMNCGCDRFRCDACNTTDPAELRWDEFCSVCKPLNNDENSCGSEAGAARGSENTPAPAGPVTTTRAATRLERGRWDRMGAVEQFDYVVGLEAEVRRLRQGLWDVAAASGADTDGDTTPDHMTYPDIVDYALQEVRELRQTYAEGVTR